MDNGQWTMDYHNGQWTMDNGQWGQEAMDKADILHQWTRLISFSLWTNGERTVRSSVTVRD
ncbi:MAG: hypothetical protein FWF88_04275 [Peptococcaceae bacterium]|nr:hypothetical protein [Peptococcaceae bacterium]